MLEQQLCDKPEAEIERWKRELPRDSREILVRTLAYRPGSTHEASKDITLQAVVCLSRSEKGSGILVGISDRCEPPEMWLAVHRAGSVREFRRLCEKRGIACFDLTRPLELLPVEVPKPWGKEIWYTGAEARGICRFGQDGNSVPIPWLLSLMPNSLACGKSALTLLKTLEPFPDEVFGDLYLELHEEKREVYVVTAIDTAAWPDGIGYLRLGVHPERLTEFGCNKDFKQAYLRAIQAYEQIRREIDLRLDQKRQGIGLALNEALAPECHRRWLSELPRDLVEQEHRLRRRMDSFTRLEPVGPGSVIKVSCHTPHALQHGVTVLEFQTPVYERKILSFGQKVLTQDHWDTVEAIELMRLDAPQETPAVLEAEREYILEQAATFDDFEVRRLTVRPGCCYTVTLREYYSLVVVITGDLEIAGSCCPTGGAWYLPPRARAWKIVNRGTGDGISLLSMPRAKPFGGKGKARSGMVRGKAEATLSHHGHLKRPESD